MNLKGEQGGRQLTAPDHLYTWVDVDHHFADLAARGRWPEWLQEVDAYWHGVRLVAAATTTNAEVWGFLRNTLGPLTIDEAKQIILLDTVNPTDADRFLPVEIELAAEAEMVETKPQWAAHRIMANLSGALAPPATEIPHNVSICVFHSFKGGVGRTLHCVAAAQSIARRSRRVLLVDADLEAPGITWMWQAQSLRVDFAFEDFLALVHGSRNTSYVEATDLGAKFLVNQDIGNVVVMPARRDYTYLEPPRIEPVDLLTADRDPYVLTNALAMLAHRLEAGVVLMDLRAGVSELNAPLLLDPRLHRVMVSTISDQSVRGSRRVLEEIARRAPARTHVDDPAVAVLITQFADPDHRDRLEEVAAELADAAISATSPAREGYSEADFPTQVMASRFDSSLLNPAANWTGVCDAIAASRLADPLRPLIDLLAPVARPARPVTSTDRPDEVRRRLADTARRLVYAETSGDEDFLVTETLDNLAEAHRTEVPIEVVIGAKGSGKTFTFLQLCGRERWSDFVNAVGIRDALARAFTVPVIDPANLKAESAQKLLQRRIEVADRLGTGEPAGRLELVDLIRQQLREDADETTWRRTWLTCFARAVGLSAVLDNAQDVLTEFARKNQVLFVVDGLEDLFQNFTTDDREQRALRMLLTDCAEWLRTLRQRPLGLLTFVRRDLAQTAVTQNFAQFEARHANYALRWNRDEALRLAAWVCQRGTALDELLQTVKEADIGDLSQLMIPVWGEKMGAAGSREARSERWFFAALSDFSGQIQARDIATFLAEAAQQSVGDRKWPGRVLAPAAMRSALPECSRQKIDAIAQENPPVGKLLRHLRDQSSDKRKVPFGLDSVELGLSDARLLETNGVLFREGDQYWIPEIFRHGLGFRASGRPRVLAIANLVRRRNDLSA